MNKVVTSKEAILNISLELGKASGIKNLNIRDIANKAGVSVGSIYNYFPSKDLLITAVIEAIWADIMKHSKINKDLGFPDNIENLYTAIKKGSIEYPDFFNAHSIFFGKLNKDSGREAMNKFMEYIKLSLLQSLEQDSNLRPDAFSEEFSKDDFISFVFSSMLSSLSRGEYSCSYLNQVIKKIIY